MSTQLEKDREQIDQIDAEITRLFEERFGIIKEIIEYKIEHRIPILDSGREEVITARNLERISDDAIRPYFRQWYAYMLDLSKEYQKEIMNRV
ncbi:MAG: chorismate mutase [Solobacterium sp.]|nr:chorismate mutase [Solobacterium sp.]